MKESLTVVIPCKNERHYIIATLRGLESQAGANGLRVIVADANSTDGTREIITDYASSSKLRIEIIDGGHVSVGRNRGAALVTTDYVLFLDADAVLFDRLTLRRAMRQVKVNNKKLITCKLKPTVPNFKIQILHSLFNLSQAIIPSSFSTGVFFLIKKSTFDRLGGFDETVEHSEDYLLSKQIPKSQFCVLAERVGQDSRRFDKMGYFGIVRFVITNFMNRNNIEHFRKSVNYWD